MRESLCPGAGQRGAVAIEFALVFVLFFMVMYGIVAYGMVFAVQHSLTQAASEGARAAVRDVGGLPERMALAKATSATAIAWLGGRAPVPQITSTPCAATPFVCVKVLLVYDYLNNPLVPALPGLGVALPARLTAQATVQLDAVY
ncbi:TadE/TadG family type IV pilus assembly protein [Quatrionicoccus australiensis]|uniref:TadE/TadG family type IV pilus assembly protein n=1 Tax=Quatrionicoccus australiensis TaxID=138118 RepID=UPI001CF90F2C|nr:TadE/TadG family type IV pilus assembly protein [Quatrionicoccus australiensis]UCV15568.1 pilus assembly protein [Quatrionicoccus australiensis]